MPKKYHIPIKTTPPRFHPVGKYATVEFREDCAGSCRECVKKKCVYDVFKTGYKHWSTMDEPFYLYECQSCFRCVQECTKGIFFRVINPEYRKLGDNYWRADIIHRTWYQAHTGKIPVSGAGYRGPFVGEGFDSMWTDMSEIVRPTRDGIHGREYIHTGVELSRRKTRLRFNPDLSIADDDLPAILEIPFPMIFRLPDFGVLSHNVKLSFLRAAHAMGTLMLMEPETITPDCDPYKYAIVPRLTANNFRNNEELIKDARMVEMAWEKDIEKTFSTLRQINPGVVVATGIPLNEMARERALGISQTGVDTLLFYADDQGNQLETDSPRFLKEIIRDIHMSLVEKRIRQKINLVFAGGIAMAEHMAKSIICGADAVIVDISLLLALECRMCFRCLHNSPCPVEIGDVDPVWGSQRIINLMGAWRNQLLEVMGAMGMREARRLRGEVGRSMNFLDLELDHFGPIFGERKVSGLGMP
jgi:ferredoxin